MRQSWTVILARSTSAFEQEIGNRETNHLHAQTLDPPHLEGMMERNYHILEAQILVQWTSVKW